MNTFERMEHEIQTWPVTDGVKVSDLVNIDDPLRGALNRAMRDGSITLAEFSGELGFDMVQTNRIVDLLLDHGFLRESGVGAGGEVEYRLRYAVAHRRAGRGAIWDRVLDHLESDGKGRDE